MTVKILKTGKYSFHPAFGPQIKFEKDEIVTRNKQDESSLIKDGWAIDINEKGIPKVEVKEEKEEKIEELKIEEPQEEVDVYEFLIEMVMKFEKESEQKSALQDWGEIEFGIKVPKRQSVENMIEELCELKNQQV